MPLRLVPVLEPEFVVEADLHPHPYMAESFAQVGKKWQAAYVHNRYIFDPTKSLSYNAYNFVMPENTAVFDGDPDTAGVELSTNSTTPVDGGVGVDLQTSDTYFVILKAVMSSPTSTTQANLALMGSADMTTWHELWRGSLTGYGPVWHHFGLFVGSRYRAFKLMWWTNGNTTRLTVYEMSVFRYRRAVRGP